MQITVENAGGCKRIIRAEIPADVVSAKLADGFRELNRQVVFPGFRKGKAPRPLLEKRFGPDVTNDVRQTLADDVLRRAVEEHALKILGTPEVTGDAPILGGKPAVLTIEAEVYPEFELPEYKGVVVSRPVPDVHEEEIRSTQRNAQMSRGKLNDLETKAKKGQFVRASIKVTAGDEVVFQQAAGMYEVGHPWLAGMRPIDVKQPLVGAKAGDTITMNVSLPSLMAREELQGREADVEMNVQTVHEFEGPSLEEVAKELGKESVEAWAEEIKAQLTSEKEADIDNMVEDRVVRKLLETANIDLPEKYSERRAAELVQQEAYRMYTRGAPEEEIRAFLTQRQQAGTDDIKAGLKRAFLLDAIARKERVIVTEDEVKREVARIAAAFGRDAEEMFAELSQRGTIAGMREEMKMKKVLSLLRQKAKYE